MNESLNGGAVSGDPQAGSSLPSGEQPAVPAAAGRPESAGDSGILAPAALVRGGIAFHGAAELEAAPMGGVFLRRMPRSVREQLGARGRFIAAESTGCELRFVTSSQTVDVTLALPVQGGTVAVYCGGMFHSEHRLQAGSVCTLRLHAPPRLKAADARRLSASGFAPAVWRVRFGRAEAVFCGLDAFGEQVRPPRPGETPELRLLAYGSSITHGGEGSRLAYIDQTARRLGVDLYNIGMSGSCLCEPELIDWIADRRDWDILFLELGVNMRDGMDDETFRSRVRYTLERISAAHPLRPIALTTIYPNFATLGEGFPEAAAKEFRFNEILREEARRVGHAKLLPIKGDTVLDDPGGLSCDLIHPADEGHIRMGENLARRLVPLLGAQAWQACGDSQSL
ncbi:SGNH/GDSL hydrolase family protein [Saccharibacillus qingshengii]|uniref:SGNH/GDSL hydrolase family protein n=1 Tax=Saccharibacillus qingshengii TaxID=1763540 RepID=UPI001552CCF2|nr:GDSL-type esterase/lipase family protein [Saccharibacillus qingshengii]